MVGKKFGYVDNSGNLVVPANLRNGNGFSEVLASVNTDVRSSIEDICTVGFINKSGGFAIRPQFLAAGRFQAGLCLVENRGAYWIHRSFGDFCLAKQIRGDRELRSTSPTPA